MLKRTNLVTDIGIAALYTSIGGVAIGFISRLGNDYTVVVSECCFFVANVGAFAK